MHVRRIGEHCISNGWRETGGDMKTNGLAGSCPGARSTARARTRPAGLRAGRGGGCFAMPAAPLLGRHGEARRSGRDLGAWRAWSGPGTWAGRTTSAANKAARPAVSRRVDESSRRVPPRPAPRFISFSSAGQSGQLAADAEQGLPSVRPLHMCVSFSPTVCLVGVAWARAGRGGMRTEKRKKAPPPGLALSLSLIVLPPLSVSVCCF